MLESLVLGLVQGVTEWLPVSSEGAVTAAGSFFFDLAVEDALAFALWLHLGTASAAIIVFRAELVSIAREAFADPFHPSPLLRFLIIASAASVMVGFPILLVLKDLAGTVGAGAMIAVGVLMLFTAYAQLQRPAGGQRDRNELKASDAVMTGVAQGLAALPGLSRSGLTVAVLLGRSVDRSEALAVSFLMSIPAGVGAAIFAALDNASISTNHGLTGAAAAMITGLISIKALMAVAHRINFAVFVAVVGVAIMAGGIAQLVF